MAFELKTSKEVLLQIAQRIKQRRLKQNLTQAGLALRAGVSVGTIKHFEKTGKVGLDILLNMALVLGCLDEFDALLLEEPKPTNLFQEDNTARQRGRLK